MLSVTAGVCVTSVSVPSVSVPYSCEGQVCPQQATAVETSGLGPAQFGQLCDL